METYSASLTKVAGKWKVSMYFIPLIAQALKQPDPRKSLLEAFQVIEAKGQDPCNREDYQQFRLFIDAAFHHLGHPR